MGEKQSRRVDVIDEANGGWTNSPMTINGESLSIQINGMGEAHHTQKP